MPEEKPLEGVDRADVVVVGAGPAGLHAALKAAVLKQSVILVDKGADTTRIWAAPAIANVPGMPGISGPDLVRRLRKDLDSYAKLAGEQLVHTLSPWQAVEARRTDDGAFRVRVQRADAPDVEDRWIEGRVLVLATGIVDRKPGVPEAWRGGSISPYVRRGDLGYCVLCEGWSLDGRDVAVLGHGKDAEQIACDLARHFGARVALCEVGASTRSDAQLDHDRLQEANVRIEPREVHRIQHGDDGRVALHYADGSTETFDKALLTYGFHKVNSDLATQLGAHVTQEGYVHTDEDCEAIGPDGKPIRGLFAVGDVRDNRWKQIVIGWGEAERAAITAYAYRLPD